MDDEESIKKECRRTARQIWHEQPDLSIDDMLARDEIRSACNYRQYPSTKLHNWILPDPSLFEELPFFKQSSHWSIEEAAALLLDLNPFILIQGMATNPARWNPAYHPALREKYRLLLQKVELATIGGILVSIEKNGKNYVTPRNFYEWAIANGEEPKGSNPEELFEYHLNKSAANIPDPNQNPENPSAVVVDHKSVMQTEPAQPESQILPAAVELPHESGQVIYDLFDPMQQAAIATLFDKITTDSWRKFFERASRNDLSNCRQGDGAPSQYNPAKVADWLVYKGHYTREHTNRKLANNLPQRSKDYKYLLTGVYD